MLRHRFILKYISENFPYCVYSGYNAESRKKGNYFARDFTLDVHRKHRIVRLALAFQGKVYVEMTAHNTAQFFTKALCIKFYSCNLIVHGITAFRI